jgi:hypothetical protein
MTAKLKKKKRRRRRTEMDKKKKIKRKRKSRRKIKRIEGKVVVVLREVNDEKQRAPFPQENGSVECDSWETRDSGTWKRM